ncbi:MAG TPA: hypothetical protein VMK42_01060 [Anaeromyxobacteraceae bacterium]|nr:hypothetical protein [Anaeromyxobacteraceae bacterium]
MPALLLFAFSLALLAAFSGRRLLHPSQAPHFAYQADAWLHGQLHLRLPPPNGNDWARVGDRFYVSFPPGPALLLLPLVAAFGPEVNDVAFTVFFAALNVALLFAVLERLSRRGYGGRSSAENAALSLLFAFGTVAFAASVRGEVWFTAEVLGITFTCLYLLAALEAAHPLLAGAAYGLGAVTRTPLLFSAAFFVLEAVRGGGWLGARISTPATWRERALWRRLAFFALGALPALSAAALLNALRFGSALDFGHAHLWNNRINADVARHGLFSLAYLPRNLAAAFLLLPRWQGGALRYHPAGMSLLATTPLLLLAPPKERSPLTVPLALAALGVALPGFFYVNTGYVQFGYRFSVDWTPYLFLLLAVGGRPMRFAFWTLALWGVAVNTWGAIAFRGSFG